ncbi:hypothetical protein [Klebsiella pneumoniae]|uniref:hypothetical protein n=1 Tax=Klebsiella pneumoniae TaxID=573 RepID=UPI001D0E2B31|nr:hypothetical protein [Klebsiella pneumoniae]
MTSKLNINWLNKCRCGNRMHTVETVRGSHVRLFEDDAVKCNACGREGVIQTCDAIATVLWETDEERAESVTMTKSTITRERLEQLADNNTICKVSWDERIELAQIALAAMDSEPVAVVEPSDYVTAAQLVGEESLRKAVRELYEGALRVGDKLYRHAQPAPVVPDSYVMVPMRLTAENGAKGALSGEFSETKFVNCPECFGDDECETCDGSGRIEITVPVTWTTIKAIWVKGVEHFAVTAQEND